MPFIQPIHFRHASTFPHNILEAVKTCKRRVTALQDRLVFTYKKTCFVEGAIVKAVQKQKKTLFSHIVINSNCRLERNFAQACEDSDDVLFYIKLLCGFHGKTPVGHYNPD